MKRVRMTQTKNMARGEQRFRYDAGKTFYLPDTVADMFLKEGTAMEDKSMDEAPETKTKKKRKKAQ